MYLGCAVEVTLAQMEQGPAKLRSQMRANSHKFEFILITIYLKL